MKAMLIFLLSSLMSFSCIAGSTVIISTLEMKEGKRFWNSNKFSIYLNIERHFQKKLLSEYNDLKFVHAATFKEIISELQNVKNENIFFIEHGGIGTEKAGISIESSIFDVNLTPIQQIFFKAHSKLKFLAIISCNSQQILEKTSLIHKLKFPKDMMLIDFNSKIEIYKGIDEAINSYKNQTEKSIEYSNNNTDNLDNEYVKIMLRKQYNQIQLPSIISINKKNYGFFLNSSSGLEFFLPSELLKNKFFTIEDDRGNYDLNSKIDFGVIYSVEAEGYNCTIKPELNSKNELIGVTKHYYKVFCDIY